VSGQNHARAGRTSARLLARCLGILAAGVALGLLCGVVASQHVTGEIASKVRAAHPTDPLDGVPMIGLLYVGLGLVAGSVAGGVASLVYLVMISGVAPKPKIGS
jgi:hypothetical protein